MKTRTRMLGASVAGLAAMTLLLTGCSSGPASGKPAITQIYHQYGEDGVEDAVKGYAADYADADVDLKWISGDYGQPISALLLAKSGIDVFESNILNVSSVKQGQYADLTDLMEPVADQYSDAALKSVMVDGKYYGVPMILDATMFFYRPSMFEEAGVAVPTTWDEFVAAVPKLTNDDHKGAFLGNDGGAAWAATNMPAAIGTGLLSDDNTKATFNTPELAGVLTDTAKLYNDGDLLLGAATDWYDPTSFLAGQAAIAFSGSWAIPAAQKQFGDDFGVFAFPGVGTSGHPSVTVSNWSALVAGSTKELEASKAMVKAQWIDDTAWQQKFSNDFGFHVPPAADAAAATPALQDGLPAEVVTLMNDNGWAAGPYWTPDMGTAITTAASNVILNGADATAELKDAESRVQAFVDQNAK